MISSKPLPILFGSAMLLTVGIAAGIAFNATPIEVQPAPPGSSDPNAAPVATNGGPNDHTMFGGTPSRNMVNLVAKDIPGKFDPDKDAIWKADLGSLSYGGPIIAGGKVFVGTNNERPRNKRDQITRVDEEGQTETIPIDRGILMCFDEKTGKFLWQAVFPKLPSGQVHDWPKEGLCSTPIVEGDRLYLVSNRCAVVCMDVNGRANGVQGRPIRGTDPKTNKPIDFDSPTDADILWEFDMMRELNVSPHNLAVCCPLIVGDIIYAVTANGVDEGHFNIPSPDAPSFIALDKNTGKLLWKQNYPGRNIMHGQWSNPCYAEINGVRQVIFPGGDGWLYGLVPETGAIIWKFDCNPKSAVYELGGAGTRSDFIATPVVYDNKVYIAVGQDPEHTDGIGKVWCISPTKKGDISDELVAGTKKNEEGKTVPVGKPNPNSCKVWFYGGDETRPHAIRDFKFGRTMSTACIVDDILYLGELPGYVHCLNAKTGEHYWQYDTKASTWGSCYYVDGKVMLGNDNGDLHVFRHTKTPEKIDDLNPNAKNQKEARAFRSAKQKEIAEKYLISKIPFDANLRSTPVVANGVLYVMSEKTLYAIKPKK
ncbi:MAG TPA: PQQ-binding-like beta-propeller repeat protein [Urbifossiella sp.]|nr:PQQ-binding-like beta-propeller repeat protein [Urbifossiella sp.]